MSVCVSSYGGGSVDATRSNSFGWSTDAELVSIVADADAGLVDLAKDCGWQVGDRRTVSLASSSDSNTNESQPAQDVTFVLLNKGGFELANGKECQFVVGVENCLKTSMKMNNSNIGSWKDCHRRAWCNNGFRNSIPSSIRGIFKQFRCPTYSYSTSKVEYTDDYFALPGSIEVFGVRTNENVAEKDYLKPFSYFAGTHRRIKTLGQTVAISNGSGARWWLRSPYTAGSFVYVNSTGDPYGTDADAAYGVAPFGCL